MKRISCLLLSLLLALLCACGDTNTPAPPDQTEPDEPETPSVPAVCSLYYDYAELEIIAPTKSKLPLAAGASHGAPDYLPLWHNGEYGQLAASGGEGYMVADLIDGKAYEEGAYGRFCWNGELYHCVRLKADSCYVPSLCSTSGGILWLELSGDCWADTGWDEIGHFGGFDMVVITGSGALTADVWMPENIVYQLWAGTITAPGIRYWPETHVLSDTVTIVDPLDAEAADE